MGMWINNLTLLDGEKDCQPLAYDPKIIDEKLYGRGRADDD